MKAAAALARLRALPVRDFADLFGQAPALILAPHPDDESLGCGGTIAEACARGQPPIVAILTDGAMSHPGSVRWAAPRLAAARREEARCALATLGLPTERLLFLDQPDTRAPHAGVAFAAVVDRLCEVIGAHGIGTVCATWQGDPHCDHAAAAGIAAATCRRTGARHLAYPVWAWTVPGEAELPTPGDGARLDVRAHLAAKRRAVAAHATQHAGLIDDDPGGFALPPEFLALFQGPWETFFAPA
jgi:LmbE family N-acetylglucosaminyl deacetylase